MTGYKEALDCATRNPIAFALYCKQHGFQSNNKSYEALSGFFDRHMKRLIKNQTPKVKPKSGWMARVCGSFGG